MPGIAPDTLERVRRAASELGYVPSERGRSLSTQMTRCIGIVAADLKNPFYPELVEPLRDGLARLGYKVLLIPDSSETDLQLTRLADGTVDGVVITTALTTAHLPKALQDRGIPFVLVNRDVDDIEADRCTVDNRGGVGALAELLLHGGHQVIGAIFGPVDTSTGRERETAFRDALQQHEMDLPDRYVARGPFDFETGRAAASAFLAREDRPTALFCANDVLAIGAYDGAISLGLVPGQDVSIVGFDGIAMSSWDLFSLTTAHVDMEALASHAVRMLMRRIEQPDLPFEAVVVPTTLALRRSHRFNRPLPDLPQRSGDAAQ